MDEIDAVLLQNIRDIEEKDERQILAELAGETIQDFIYETEVWEWTTEGGRKRKEKKRKVKLSWVGTREVARSRGNIVVSDPIVTDLEDNIRIVVKATDLTRNFSVFGGCHQPRKMKVNDYGDGGEIVGFHLEDDPYIFQKGLSKAQRNALQSCIPATYATKAIDRFLKAAGKHPLLTPGKAGVAGTSGSKGLGQGKSVKPRTEWEKIAKEAVPDYATLERLIWDLAKIQPREMYKQLGVSARSEMNIMPWDAFLNLKEIFVPKDL